jgi:cyclic pyranopterin phosphate synthase
MPEHVEFMDRAELLTFEEIIRFLQIAIPLGVNKVRLTGGEPLLRRGLPRLVAMIGVLDGIRDLALTTNGILLSSQARELYAAGLRRLNISLDTLDRERFRHLTLRDELDRVLAGINAAIAAGFKRIKLNAVSIRGTTEHEIVPLARYARDHGMEMRFIEYMPIGANAWERDKVLYAREILEVIESEVGSLVPVGDYDPSSPATEFEYADGGGRIGIIASVSMPFCKKCNRIRLTADGKLRNCLFALEEADVKALLRSNAADDAIVQVIRGNVRDKGEGHQINTARFLKPLRTMHAIGG